MGNFESATGGDRTVTVRGWTIDPDTKDPIDVQVSVDGRVTAAVKADKERPDLARSYKRYGTNHGFLETIAVEAGRREVCAVALNVAAGENKHLGCREVTVGGSPFGTLDSAEAADGGVAVRGWALDPDITGPVTVDLTVDGVAAASLTAGTTRWDIGRLYPFYGNDHGFEGVVPADRGPRRVCALARNVGLGADHSLGCRDVVVGGSPFGNFERATPLDGAVEVRGWVIDPDTVAPVEVTITADGTAVARLRADQLRWDIGRVFPYYGTDHGFLARIDLPAGQHRVCAVATNVGIGADHVLGCYSTTVGGSPVGALDVVTVTDGILGVTGWAVDPDTTDPVTVVVTVDGGPGTQLPADGPRNDLPAAYAAYGANRGFTTSLAAAPGPHKVCALAVNVGFGGDRMLGCRDVVVGGSPFGTLDAVAGLDGALSVRGWAIDPDTTNPIDVTVNVDGTNVTTVVADAVRSDVGGAHPFYGSGHGFDRTLDVKPGPHQVCVAARNVGTGADVQLGCRDVVVGGTPFGNFERATAVDGGVDLKAWVIDPDTIAPVSVTIQVDGSAVRTLAADGVRGDIGRAFPYYGENHGLAVTVPAAAGAHRVCVVARNVGFGSDKTLGCYDVTVAAPLAPEPLPPVEEPVVVEASTEPAGSEPPASTGGMPDASSTGVPAGLTLTRHDGDMVITTPGAVIDRMDIHGTVSVRADNVTIKNTRIRGRAATYNTPLVSMNKGNVNLRIIDTEIAPDNPSPYLYGIMGWEFTLERVNIHHVIDSAHIYGPNVTIRSSWLHSNAHFENDPNWGGKPSHDDGIQIQTGDNIRIIGSRIEGAYNAAIQITQDRGPTRNVTISGNWLDGGGCTVNLAEKSYGPMQGMLSEYNTFGRATRHYDCAMISPTSTPLVAQENYFTDGVYARVRNGG